MHPMKNLLAMAATDFLVTLPSNSNMATNPSNEPSSYTVKLAEALQLEGDWEAALVSVQYTPTWLTFNNTLYMLIAYIKEPNFEDRPDLRPSSNILGSEVISKFNEFEQILGKHGLSRGQIERRLPGKGNLTLTLRVATLYPKYYGSVVELGNAVCSAINEVTSSDNVTTRYEYDYASKRGYIVVNGAQMRVALENYIKLGDLLGHDAAWIKCDKCEGWATHQRQDASPHYFLLSLTGYKQPNLPKVNSLWMYTNITQNQQVGDTKAPLLGIVPTTNTTIQRIHYTVNPIHFLALNRNFTPEITIQIMDDRGKRVPFATGDGEDNLVCCLRFRRRKALMPI